MIHRRIMALRKDDNIKDKETFEHLAMLLIRDIPYEDLKKIISFNKQEYVHDYLTVVDYIAEIDIP